MEAKKLSHERVIISMDMAVIVSKHTQKNLQENIMSGKTKVAHKQMNLGTALIQYESISEIGNWLRYIFSL